MDAPLSFEEFPVYVPFGEERLSGVVCAPALGGEDLGALMLAGSDSGRTHRNSMWAKVGRALAAWGFPSLRVDFLGAGDSTGTARFDSEDPLLEDVLAAARFLRRAVGTPRLVLVGSCFGARSAIAAAAVLPEAIGVVAFSPFALVDRDRRPSRAREIRRRTVYRLKRRAPWLRRSALGGIRRAVGGGAELGTVVSPALKRALAGFLPRGEVCLVMGETSGRLAGVRRCLEEVGPLLDPASRGRVHLDVVPGATMQGFRSLPEQDLALRRTLEHVRRIHLTGGRGPREATADLAGP